MVTAPRKVVPGDQICKFDERCVLGGGIHVHQGVVYSSLLGMKLANFANIVSITPQEQLL